MLGSFRYGTLRFGFLENVQDVTDIDVHDFDIHTGTDRPMLQKIGI